MSRDNSTYKEVYNRGLDFVRLIGVKAKLPTELELSEEWASSRTTIRAVLAELKEKKIIDWSGRNKTVLRRPKKRFPEATVSKPSLWNLFSEAT